MTITQAELARRLKSARESCGLTQQRVADDLGFSRPTLTQIELGHRSVSSIELQKLAYCYGRDVRSFLTDSFEQDEPVAALFRAHPDIARQQSLQRAICDCLVIGRELTNLERLLGIGRDLRGVAAYPVGRPKSKWDAIEQGSHVAREERRRLGLGDAPIASAAELLESQGIRTAQVDLPDDVSGMTLFEPAVGVFIVSNKSHPWERRRFSYAHEYAHVLFDRDQAGIVSRTADRQDLIEVRANTFAASFLMPDEGVENQVRVLGKGRASRLQAEVFDEDEAVQVRTRPAPGTQEIQLYDVARLARHFGTSRLATLYCLRNLRLITEARLEVLKEQDRRNGPAVARLVAQPRPDDRRESNEFRDRFLVLALEAWRREEITTDKLLGLARLVEVDRETVDRLLQEMGLAVDDGDEEPLIPRS